MAAILGFDHICASCAYVEGVEDQIDFWSFQRLFIEKQLLVPKEKHPFLRQVPETHQALFLKSEEGISVELINHHGRLSEWQSPYQVVLNPKQNGFLETDFSDIGPVGEAIELALNTRVVKCILPDLKLTGFQTDVSTASGNGLVALACQDLSQMVRFWQEGVGLQVVKSTKSWCLMEFLSPIPAWCFRFLLVETDQAEARPFFMDDSGWTCLSFLVTNMTASLKTLETCGCTEVGCPYPACVGGKDLRLCFLRGPESELIELIQIERSGGL